MSVILIGFMCSGKSTVGRALAPLLGLPFADIDRVVEQRVGPITPFFQRQGEEAFRREERAVLEELLAGPPMVIATGGGTPGEGDNMALMKAAGTVVRLQVPMPALMARIERSGGDRPLLFGLKEEALRAKVEELLAQREEVYASADLTVEAGDAAVIVAERIAQALAADQVK